MMSFLICGFVITIVAAVDPDADAVVFPGWGTYNFKTYSGYIPVGTGLRYILNIHVDNCTMFSWKVKAIQQQIQLCSG